MSSRYWAFLSYSHADEAAALRLHRALESYTLPRQVRKAHSLPRRLIPVFRDVDELAAASALSTRLQAALDDSRWLIVLCSPASAQSKYVNAEIEHFLRKHGADRVLCVLHEGAPPHCFPPAIRALDQEPLAADLRSGADFELGLLKLIAAMAMIGFTELRNREAQRRRRARILSAAAAGGLALGALGYWDLYVREHVDYYAGYVRRNGIWEGVDPISLETASHRFASYRFTRRGRAHPPDRVDYVNGSGACQIKGLDDILGDQPALAHPWAARRNCSAHFEYTRDGAITREALHNALGNETGALTYTDHTLAQFTINGYAAPSAVSGVNYVKFERDARGFDTQIRFLHAKGTPRPNSNKAFGYDREYDDAGHVTRSAILGSDSRQAEVERTDYSPEGYVMERRHEDAAGQLAPGREGWTLARYERDAAGNEVLRSLLDAEGKPTTGADGYAAMSRRYDEHGNPVEIRFLDERGRPTPANSNAAILRFSYDAQGRITLEEYLGPDGKPADTGDGAASQAYAYDAAGNPVEMRWFDIDGKPTNAGFGAASNKIRFDAFGNPVERDYYDADGKPVNATWGHRIKLDWDERGNCTRIDYLDVNGKPYARTDWRFAGVTYLNDARGNVVEMTYLGADGQPVLNDEGMAFVVYRYDDLGNEVEKRMLDTARKLVRRTDGWAIERQQYNALGQVVVDTLLDEHERPAPFDDGSYGHRLAYDSRGRVSQQTFLDAAGKPMSVGGHHGVRNRLDNNGNLLEETYLDAQGAPLTGPGLARMVYTLDNRGLVTEKRALSGDGRPVEDPATGCTSVISEYYPNSRIARVRCLDAAGALHMNRQTGWAEERGEPDKLPGQERYLDAQGREVRPKR